MRVVATAGHVDHGKSTLVRALTGMQPDRWAEERRRGMTIDLGFAWTTLPSGGRIAFVDVPGHERFLTNMLAGVGSVPAVMIVVAADEGWMPQSAEHLAAIDALGVRHGLLVVTRTDLADPAPALARARAEIRPSTLGEVDAVTVSGATGEGVPGLRAALGRLTAALPMPAPRAPVRIWIDRAFTVRGSGTVVTGTLPAGTVRVGDELLLGERTVAVRALQALGEHAELVSAVARVALDLRGVDRRDVGRGTALVTAGRWSTTDTIDVRVDDAAALPREPILHIGSAGVPVRSRPLGGRAARLSLTRPLPLHVGDRALLRDPGRRAVVGATVLDVAPPPLGRRGAARDRGRELASWPAVPDAATLLRRYGTLRRGALATMGVASDGEPVVADWLVDPEHWAALRGRLFEAVARHADTDPLDPGLPVEAARAELGLPDRRLVDALVLPPLRLDRGRVYGAVAELPIAVAEAVRRLRAELAETPFHAPEAGHLAELGLTGRALGAAVRAGVLLRLPGDVVLPAGADHEAVPVLAGLAQPFTVSEARRALGTTRRVAVPLLEHLDALGSTERVDDLRRRVR